MVTGKTVSMFRVIGSRLLDEWQSPIEGAGNSLGLMRLRRKRLFLRRLPQGAARKRYRQDRSQGNTGRSDYLLSRH